MDKLSVLVPIYNGESYIERGIKSILSQTYKPHEIIIYDDGSTDRSRILVKKYLHDGIKFLCGKHYGLSNARNELLKNVTGNLIFFFDIDDFMSVHTLEYLVKVLHMTNADIVQCSAKDTNKYEIKEEEFDLTKIVSYSKYEALAKYGHSISGPRCVPTGKIYNKKVFNNISYPYGKIHEDVFVAHRLLSNCDKYAILDQQLYYYYENPNSIIRKKFSKERYDILEAYEDAIKFYANRKMIIQVEWFSFRMCITIADLYKKTKRYYGQDIDKIQALMVYYKKYLRYALRIKGMDKDIKNELIKFMDYPDQVKLYDYWYYVQNKIIV